MKKCKEIKDLGFQALKAFKRGIGPKFLMVQKSLCALCYIGLHF